MIYVESSIYDEVDQARKSARAKATPLKLTTSPSEAASAVTMLAASQPYAAIVLPAPWADSIRTCELEQPLEAGTLRLVFWGAPPAAPLPFPAWFIPTDRGPGVTQAMLRHLERASLPGVGPLLPEGAKIFSERVSSSREIGFRLDKILELAVQQDPELGAKTMTLRLIASACLASAFENPGKTSSLVKLQLGVAPGLSAFSIRWPSTCLTVDAWSKGELPWKLGVLLSDAFWIQLVPDSSEVEAVFLTAKDASSARKSGWEILPLGVDILTNSRFAAMNACVADPSRFEYSPVPTGDKTQVSGSNGERKASGGKGSESLGDLEAENERMASIIEHYRLQMASMTKKFVDLMQSEKKAQQEARSLKLQLSKTGQQRKAG